MPDEKAPSSGAFLPASLMYFCSGQPMHLCSGVDIRLMFLGKIIQPIVANNRQSSQKDPSLVPIEMYRSNVTH